MIPISRRQFMRDTGMALSAIPFSDWLGKSGLMAATSRIRHGLHTQKGQENLAFYRTAVKRMKDLSNDPVLMFNTWTYQYKLHLFPDHADLFNPADADDLKRLRAAQLSEIDHFYPATDVNAAAQRKAADQAWGQCPHDQPDFLVWHRMYLFFFEQIIRKVANAPDFTLPYWGYSTKTQRVIPRALRTPMITGGLVENSLFHARNVLLNDLNNPLSVDDSNVENPSPGDRYWNAQTFADFSARAEGVPHNRIHVALGTNGYDGFDMFRVAMAPRDPIFWLHHCEIDRIWHSWTAAGGAKPDTAAPWLDRSYYFMDGDGALVDIKGKDVLETSQLDYTYDEVIARPAAITPLTLTQVTEAAKQNTIADSTKVTLTGPATSVRLTRVPGLQSLATVADLGPRQLILRLEGVNATRAFTANLDVYLNLPEGANPQQKRDSLVGVIGVFGALRHGTDHRVDYQFDATPVARRLLAQGRWTAEPQVIVLVAGGGFRGAVVTIEKVSLVAVPQ